MDMSRVVPLFAALTLLHPTVASSAPTLSGTESPVVVAPGDQLDPAISGPYVVYTDTGGGNSDVFYFDSGDSSIHPVAVGPGDQQLSDVSGTRIVYTNFAVGMGDIWLYDIIVSAGAPLIAHPLAQFNPAVSSSVAAWEDLRGPDPDVWVHDLVAASSAPIMLLGAQHSPSASGSRVVFVDDGSGGAIRVFNQADSTLGTVHPGPAMQPDIDGDNVVFAAFAGSDFEIFLRKADATPVAALSLPGDQLNPHLSGDWVAFEDHGHSGGPHVALWHVPSGGVYYPAPGSSQQILNDISGTRVVYTDNRNGDFDIFAYDFEIVDPPPADVDCDDPGANVLATLVLQKDKGPTMDAVEFSVASNTSVLVCIDADKGATGWIVLNSDLLARPNDFGGGGGAVHLERESSVPAGENVLAGRATGKKGSTITVRVLEVPDASFAAYAAQPAHPRAEDVANDLAQGCSTTGGAGWALFLAILAILRLPTPRPARAAVRALRRR
jgi:beta propeller repeat protein